jgi:lipooligosaccharide transport system ATP-binding protein
MLGDTTTLVRAHRLVKRFGDFVAVDGIDLEVHRGETFGFLGANGAGKSSTMRMIGCVSSRTSGDLSVFGLEPDRHGSSIRARLGVVSQEDNLDTELTVWDNLVIYGRYFDLPRAEIHSRVEELLEFAQLTERRHDRVDPLSGGMKRRLAIARALVNRPELVLLDEPTTGLDPQARHLLWERLYQLKRAGATLVLTTHYLDEAEQLCDRLVIMEKGQIVAEGSPRSLIDRHATREVVELRMTDPSQRQHVANDLRDHAARIELLAERVLLYTDDSEGVERRLAELAVEPASMLVRRSTLEDVYLMITGRELID